MYRNILENNGSPPAWESVTASPCHVNEMSGEVEGDVHGVPVNATNNFNQEKAQLLNYFEWGILGSLLLHS